MNKCIKLMVPNKFDNNLLSKYVGLNDEHKDIKITEQYGSIPGIDPIGSARENKRLPKITTNQLEEYVKLSNHNEILCSWTINSSCFGTLKDLKKAEKALKESIEYLDGIGIGRYIIAHPLIISLVKQWSNTPIECSTIAHIETVSQVEEIIDMGCDKVCMSLNINRNPDILNELRQYPIITELMATEMCNFNCIQRRFHYALQSHQTEVEEDYCKYPYNYCTRLKNYNIVNWIKAPFILPQWMEIYNELFGINNFKITGRTFPSEVIYPVVKAYMDKNYEGNLLELWTPLEYIGKENECKKPNVYIDTKFLDKKFIMHFLQRETYFNCNTCSNGNRIFNNNNNCNHCYNYTFIR